MQITGRGSRGQGRDVCGVIGGVATLSDKVSSYFPSAKIAVTTGGRLELLTNPQGGAEIRYGLVLNNTGGASGTFDTQSARLEVLDADAAKVAPLKPPVHLHSGDVPSDVPFGVKVADLKQIQVSVDLSPEALERLIGGDGLRRVEVELMSGRHRYASTYCFWLGSNLVQQFRAQGQVLFEQPDADAKCAAASK